MIVTFCGHSSVPNQPEIKELLIETIRGLILEGADTFYLGGYGSFDLLSAHAVKDMKADYPHIRSVLVIPYLDRAPDMTLYDESVYPPLESVPKRFAISRRNEWMIDQTDVVVSGVTHDWGGAAKTLDYATRRKKRIITLISKR